MYLTIPSIECGTHFTHLPLTHIRPPTPEPLALSRTPPSPGTTALTVSNPNQKHSRPTSSNGTAHSAASPTWLQQLQQFQRPAINSSTTNIIIISRSHDRARERPQLHRQRTAAAMAPIIIITTIIIIMASTWSAQRPLRPLQRQQQPRSSIAMLPPLLQQPPQLRSLCK